MFARELWADSSLLNSKFSLVCFLFEIVSGSLAKCAGVVYKIQLILLQDFRVVQGRSALQ
jgi:hypothetical protein